MLPSHHRPLNWQDYKTLTLAALGGALEFYDFIIYVFFATILGQLFFPENIPLWLRQVQTFGIFAAGYLARPLGGIIMAHFGDLVGRKKMFSLSILLMAIPTLAIGMLPTYSSIGIAAPLLLLLMRVLQGAAIGGEVPGAWVFVSEHVPPKKIGLACGILTSGLTAGILLGSLVATLIKSKLPEAQLLAGGWRIPFILGGVFGLFAMYLRRWLEETPIFMEMKARQALAAELPLKSVITQHRKAIIISMLFTWLLSAGIVVVILMAPSFLETQYKIPPVVALHANTLAIIALTLGCIIAGMTIDRFGAGKTFILGSLFLGFCTWNFYASLGTHPEQLLLTYPLAGLSVGIVGAIPFVMVHAFPAEIRFSGISFSYNVAYAVVGGLTPVIVTLLTKYTPMAPAYYVLALAAIGFCLGVYLYRNPWQTNLSISPSAVPNKTP